jgi:hypothetical protein
MEFEKFPKIARLFRPIIITEKIDGTNGQINVPEDPSEPIIAGSRKRLLWNMEPDNFGFRAWVEEHEDELRELGPGRHFGEWWGQGIQRNYGLSEKRFSLFNVCRWKSTWVDNHSLNRHVDWGDDFWSHKETRPVEVPDCCYVVPVLYVGPFRTTIVQNVLGDLQRWGSAAAPGFGHPEGVVTFHVASGALFKTTIEDDGIPKRKDPNDV